MHDVVKRSLSFAACCIGVAMVMTPAGHAQPAQNTLRIRLNADIRTTDPGVNRDANTDAVVAHLVEGLVALREDASVAPMLAQSVSVSPDGKAYTFKLRPGLKFSNGAALTADDVVSSWNRYMAPETGWRCLTEFDGRGLLKVLNVEARDPQTVVYSLDRASPLFLATLARPDCGGTGVFHKSSLGADGKWKEPIGSGPFKLAEWKRGQFIELARNEQYVSLPGKPDGYAGNKSVSVGKVRFVIVPDESATKAALLSGGIDVVFDIHDEDAPEYRTRKDLVMSSVPTMGVNGILFQTRDPLLKDVRIRRAIALSLDLPQIVESVTFNSAKPNRSPIPPASTYYGPAQASLPKRDVAAARKLLEEAKYRGEVIKVIATRRYMSFFNTAVLMQAMVAEAGIKMEIEVLDWATQQDRYLKGAYQVMSHGFSPRLDPSLSYEMFTGSKDTQPRKVWESPEAIELVSRSMEVSDKAERRTLIDKLDAKLREDVPAVWVYSEVRTSAARNYVKGYAGWPLGQPRAWGISFVAP